MIFLKIGSTFGIIVIVNVSDTAHSSSSGVNVYVVVAVLLIAGDQLPSILFDDVVGKAGIVAPAQYGPTGLNVGVTGELTVIANVAVAAHCPADGVNMYVVVAVLLIAGDQVPDTPFKDVVGNAGILSP